MELKLYTLLLCYFLLGAIAFARLNKKKKSQERKNNWIKYSSYLILLHLLFFAIYFDFFPLIVIVLIIGGYFELFRLLLATKDFKTGVWSLVIFSIGFYFLFINSSSDKKYLYFLLFIVTVFDAFSQITGQYLGKRKLVPSISPNKTVEGLAGGLLFGGLTGLISGKILGLNLLSSLGWAIGIAFLGFAGDLIASVVKRKFGVKDFSNLIPGHGGILDRFDSLVFGSLFLQIIVTVK